MEVFCTYCSFAKNKTKEKIPAIQRYCSSRISRVYAAALCIGIDFFILSGEFGLVNACQPIPYYDHLLKPEEVSSLAQKVTNQIKGLGIQKIIYVTKPLTYDEKIIPYYDTIKLATKKVRITLYIVEFKE